MNRSVLRACVLLAGFLTSISVTADENFRFSGFGTLGTVFVDSDYYGYRSDISFDDGSFEGKFDPTSSKLGVQAEYTLNQDTDLVAQFLYRDQPELTLDTATRLAFVRYSPSVEWDFRLGRTSFDVFHLSEYTEIGFAYPWAKAPSEVYSLIPYRHMDGVDVSYTYHFGNKTLRTKLFGGQSEEGFSQFREYQTIKVEDLIGMSIELDASDVFLKANYTEVNLSNEVHATGFLSSTVRAQDPAAWPDNQSFADQLELNNKNAHYASISARYDLNDWSFISEVSHVSGDGDSVYLRSTRAGYFSAIRNFEKHAVYVTHAFAKTKAYEFSEPVDPVAFAPLIEAINDASNFFDANQRSMSVGVRWNISDTMALKAQWERAVIKEGGTPLWLPKDAYDTPREIVHSFYFNLNFIF